VFSFPLLSNTGTFPLLVHVLQAAAVHKLALFAGVYHNAVVTSQLSIHVIYHAPFVKSPVSLGIVNVTAHVCQFTDVTAQLSLDHQYQSFVFFNTCHAVQAHGLNHVGTLHQSLISFHVAQSNTAKCQSVEEFGQTTSHAHCQSAQSLTVKLSLSQFVSVIVTVVIFQTLLLVILATQFHVAPVAHCGIVKSNTAALLVHVFVTLAFVHGLHVVVVQTVIVAAAPSCQSVQSFQSLPSTQSFPSFPSAHAAHCGIVKFNTAALLVQLFVTLASVPASHVVVVHTVIVAAVPSAPSFQSLPSFQSAHAGQVSHFSHFRLEYLAFFILLLSSLSAIKI
jgi:hypothetical protein